MTDSETAPPKTVEEFQALVASIEAREGYERPAAFAIGWSTQHGDSVVFCQYPVTNVGENFGSAAILADAVGHLAGSGTYNLTDDQLKAAFEQFNPFRDEWKQGDGSKHANMTAVWAASKGPGFHDTLDGWAPLDTPRFLSNRYLVPVVTFISNLDEPPADVYEAYLRLHLLSTRKVRPHGQNLDGLFGKLPNVAWTNYGPFLAEDFDFKVRLPLLGFGESIIVYAVDKFPPMLNCVLPSGVRVADGARVRLGAYLSEGTTVMQEGFVNFNAGTLGECMVEGRLSAGVTVGAHSDIGGGVSTQGTLSGGNDVVVSLGEYNLAEAEAGVGIPMGDRVRVEAGFYLKSTTPVFVAEDPAWVDPIGKKYQGTTVKAMELTGISDAIFRRNASTGRVEVVPRGDHIWGKLNPELHSN